MTKPTSSENTDGDGIACEAIFPQAFSAGGSAPGARAYLDDPLAQKLAVFFDAKGLAAIKEEDGAERWYEDWIAYQAAHQLYAGLLCPRGLSTRGTGFELLRYARFLEVFAYFSPAHGYSLQVTFLGLFAILMGRNTALKKEAAAALEAGGLFALGVSEQRHGSDLLGNEFVVSEPEPGRLIANGTKFYIGNANRAAMISILARKQMRGSEGRSRRDPLVLFALRPADSKGFGGLRKIRTLGVRSAYVGEFEVKDHELPEKDLFAEGRAAWDAVFGTVSLGKFFLGFGSIGICEHAMLEAVAHLSARILYGKPAIRMPHLSQSLAEAYARLTAMKLFAYRALDYVQAAGPEDRRYLLYTAVQKARVSTEAVKVMALISECVGAKGFESDTFIEMALRDAQLVPGLEGSTHINLGLTAQFIPRYFSHPDEALAEPESLFAGARPSLENPYLYEARSGALHTIGFPEFQRAYRPIDSIANVHLFAGQAEAFAGRVQAVHPEPGSSREARINLALGRCMATIVYGQLIAENAVRLSVPREMISAIFCLLIGDLSELGLNLAALVGPGDIADSILRGLVIVPLNNEADWASVAAQMTALAGDRQ